MSTTTVAPEEAEAGKKGGKKKLLIMMLAVLLLGGGGGYWFFLKPASAEEEEPVPGEVLPIEAIQINLQDNHYLRLGIELQQVEGGHGEVDGSKALDATIEIFSGESMEELAEKKYRQKLKKELEHELDELYHHEVMGVYFTDFVMQ